MIRLALFDLDGTLVHLDTNYVPVREKVHDLISSFGIKNDTSLRLLGQISRAENMLASRKKDPYTLKYLCYKAIQEAELAASPSMQYSYWSSFILETIPKNIQKVIVTNNGLLIASKAVKRFFPDNNFNIIPREIVRPKPHPEGIRLAMKTYGVSKHETIFVGNNKLIDGRAAYLAGLSHNNIYIMGGGYSKITYLRELESLNYDPKPKYSLPSAQPYDVSPLPLGCAPAIKNWVGASS